MRPEPSGSLALPVLSPSKCSGCGGIGGMGGAGGVYMHSVP